MANAKQEFISTVGNRIVTCALIDYYPYSSMNEDEKPSSAHRLHVGYTQEEYNAFVDSLDFVYDDGYGIQELYGTIWYSDGTWSDRYDYDGSECWDYHCVPTIPNELIFSTL